MSETSAHTPEKNQWRSPIFLAGIGAALIIIIGVIASFLIRSQKSQPSLIGTTSIQNFPIGVPVNEERLNSMVAELLGTSDQNNLLITTTLRTTHTGFVSSITRLETTDPNGVALVLDLIQPDGEPGAQFQFTLAETQIMKWLVVTREGVSPTSLDELQLGQGISITRITNLMADDNPDEITIEVTKQAWEQ